MWPSVVPTFAPVDAEGRPMARFGPDHVLTENYVRRHVREALALPEEERRSFWLRRRGWVARKLYEAGLEEEEVCAALRAFNARARREVEVQRIMLRVELEAVEHGGDP